MILRVKIISLRSKAKMETKNNKIGPRKLISKILSNQHLDLRETEVLPLLIEMAGRRVSLKRGRRRNKE